MQLNEEQTAAVEHPLGRPACLIAGAGSGKTRVLTERVRWLIAQGVPPRKICCVTFTNKAANELVERLGLEEGSFDIPKVSTIHSLALSAIRRSPTGFGLQDKVTPLDDYDQHVMIKRILERTVDVKDRGISPGSWVYTFLDKVSFHRSRGLGFCVEYTDEIHEEALIAHAGYHALEPLDLQIWKLYEDEKKKNSVVDFDDMLHLVVRRLRADIPYREAFQRTFDHVLMDESQDTNTCHWEFINYLMAPDKRDFYAVGDLSQSIYAFNGAEPRLLREYSEGWRGAVPVLYKIAKNHRSLPRIIYLANHIQSKMTAVIPLKMSTFRGDAENKGTIELTRASLPLDIALIIAGEIAKDNQRKKGHIPYKDNCFSGETKFLMKGKGFTPLKDNVGSCMVLNSQRKWVPAEIKKFSKQRLLELVVSVTNNNRRASVYTTAEHRWKLADGTEKTTIDLLRGDKIPYINYKRNSHYTSIDYFLGIRHGLIYGDGSAVKGESTPRYKTNGRPIRSCKRVMGYKIRICGDGDDLLPYFEGYPTTPHSSGDPIVYLYDNFSATHDLKLLPSENETEDYLVGFFRGWMAADGTISRTSSPNICCGPEEEGWLRRVMPNFGYYFAGVYEENLDKKILIKGKEVKRKKRSRNVRIVRSSLVSADFLISRKRDLFNGYTQRVVASVCSVSPTNREEEVYCAIVPSTNDFVIEGGLLTGNCILVRSARQIMDIENALVRYRIPYQVRGGKGLLQTEEIRDVLSYLRLITNPKDFTALVRAVGVPKRGVGDVALEKIRKVAREKHDGDLILGSNSVEKLGLFVQQLQSIQQYRDFPTQALDQILIHMDYKNYINTKYKKEPDKAKSKLENIDRFKELIRGLTEDQKMTTDDVVFQLTLDRAREDDKDGMVTVSTIHGAKGLEWPRVYVTNIVEGSLPHRFSMGSEEEVEEERRLFYVACTRAKDWLTLCVPAMAQNGSDTQRLRPSRFLAEVGVVNE